MPAATLQVLSRFKPSRLLGIDYHPTFLAQARFVQQHFALDCEIRQYEFLPTTSSATTRRGPGLVPT